MWDFELKNIIKLPKVDQQSQVFVGFSTLESSKPEGAEFGIRVELRKVRVEVLRFNNERTVRMETMMAAYLAVQHIEDAGQQSPDKACRITLLKENVELLRG